MNKFAKNMSNGSLWIDNSTGNVYKKINDKWEIQTKPFKSNANAILMNSSPNFVKEKKNV